MRVMKKPERPEEADADEWALYAERYEAWLEHKGLERLRDG